MVFLSWLSLMYQGSSPRRLNSQSLGEARHASIWHPETIVRSKNSQKTSGVEAGGVHCIISSTKFTQEPQRRPMRHRTTLFSARTPNVARARKTPPPTGQSYYPRTPQDTPGHINTFKNTFIRSFLLCFLNQIRVIFIECVIKSNITIKNMEYVCLFKYE